MKKAFVALFCVLAVFLSACTKHGLIPAGNTIHYCRITSITFDNLGFGLTDTLTFYYNPDGSPSRVDRAFVDDGSPKYIFRYDKQGRLLDYIGALGNGAAEFWTRYYYDEAHRTVIDTNYTDASEYQTWPPVVLGDALSEVKRYDELGRIISYENRNIFQQNGIDTFVVLYSRTYSYNRQGNITGGQYDNKIEYHRTNRVWQFVDNNYDENNGLSTTAATHRRKKMVPTIDLI